MKVIFSRKGFDSSYGGAPSPILPDGTLFSLPIPSPDSPITYDELGIGSRSVGALVEDLTNGRIQGGDGAHLDPDLRKPIYPRLPGWRPLFGQDGTAQAHLANAGVGVGDLFLFFGWFRQTEETEAGYRFVQGAPDLHVVFGWLQVDRIVRVEKPGPEIPAWAEYHPHFHRDSEGRNTVYVARESLCLPAMPGGLAGAGVFDRYRDALCLTAPGHTRTGWRLPRWFFPDDGKPPLTYHGSGDRWTVAEEYTLLRSAPRGQEFVLDVNHYPEAAAWVYDVISGAFRGHQS
jgi:hypothetical protein